MVVTNSFDDLNNDENSNEKKSYRLKKRVEICDVIFSGCDRHFTASDISAELHDRGFSVCLATVYNTLHALSRKGLIRRLPKLGQVIYFDTCTTEHVHIFDEDSGILRDAPEGTNRDLIQSFSGASDIIIFMQVGKGDGALNTQSGSSHD